MQPWALVSPASRGIGFEVARRLLATTTLPIVATTRKDPGHTKEAILEGIRDVDPARLSVYKVDVLGKHPYTLNHHPMQLTAFRGIDC